MQEQLTQLIATAQDHFIYGQSDDSIAVSKEIIELAQNLNDDLALGYGYFYCGTAQWELKAFPESMESLTEAVRLAKGFPDDPLLAKVYYVIGCSYREIGLEKRALGYMQDSTTLFENLPAHDPAMKLLVHRGLGRNLTIIGQIYIILNDLDKAEEYLQRSLVLKRESGKKTFIPTSLMNLGFVYIKRNQPLRAKEVFMEAIRDLSSDDKNPFHYHYTMLGLAITNMALNEYDEAQKDLVFLLSIARGKAGYHSIYNESLEHLSELYAIRGEYQKAYELSAEFARSRQEDFGHAYVDAIALMEAEQGKAKREQQIEQAKHANLKMTLTALRAQMDPHFIFNLLHSVGNKIEQQDPQEAKKILERFALLMRQNLELAINESITLENEIDFLTNYIELEQLRLKDRFTYSLTVDNELETELIRLPGMLIQPYIENAIKHGLAPQETGGKLGIIFRQVDDDTMECIVSDNGVGRSKVASDAKHEISDKQFESRGMSITDKRIDMINTVEDKVISVSIKDLALSSYKTGTEVSITIKI